MLPIQTSAVPFNKRLIALILLSLFYCFFSLNDAYADISDQEFQNIKNVLNLSNISDSQLSAVLNQEIQTGVTLGSQISAIIAQFQFGLSLRDGSYYTRYSDYFNSVVDNNTGLKYWKGWTADQILSILCSIPEIDAGEISDVVDGAEMLFTVAEISNLWTDVVTTYNDQYLREYIASMDTNGGNDQDAWSWLEPGIIGNKENVHAYFLSAWKAYAMSKKYDSIISELRAAINPGITYTPSYPYAPAAVTFSASGKSLSQMNIVLYSWDFGDGQTGVGQTVSHNYKTPKSYWVTLTLTDADGNTSDYGDEVDVLPPEIDVSYPEGYESLKRGFSTPDKGCGSSSSPCVTQYSWSYDDGTATELGISHTHPYANSGYYNVTLTETLDDNSTIQSQAGIFVGPGTRIIQGHTITGSETWYSGGTYQVQGSIIVAHGATLTIQPGTNVQLSGGVAIMVNGTLNASGVKFTWADGATQWGGIEFSGSGANGSKLENCTLEHASGYWQYYYIRNSIINIVNSSPTITSCTIGNNDASYGIVVNNGAPVISGTTVSGMKSYGMLIQGGGNPIVTGSTFSGNQYGLYLVNGRYINEVSTGTYTGNTFSGNQYGVSVYYGTTNPFFANNIYSNNSITDFYATGGTINSNVIWDGMSESGNYRVSTIIVAAGATLNIQAGRTVKLDGGDSAIMVNGTLNASGVKFTWADGATQWGGIEFSGSGANGSKLENCTLEHASGYWQYYYIRNSIINIVNSSPTITSCTIGNNDASYGIVVNNGAPVISGTTVSGMKSYGMYIYIQGVTLPTVSGNTFVGNSYGLYYSGSGTLQATNNNWGDPSGPCDPSDDRATGGLYNPNGKGDKVSDHVNYYPWTGSTVGQTAVPTGLSGTPGYRAINLTWNANSETYIGGYKIYYGTVSGNYGSPIIVGNVTSYKLPNLSAGTPYYIAISSLNSVGSESAKTTEIQVTPANTTTLTVTMNGSGAGTIGVNTGSLSGGGNTVTATFPVNTSVNISAYPGPDSSFAQWGGACHGNGSPCSLQMTDDESVTATFNSKTDFSGDPITGSAPLVVRFTDKSISAASWFWDFGDGSTSTVQNPIHMYKNAGTYTVQLTANGILTTKNNYIFADTCTNPIFNIYGVGICNAATIKDACSSLQSNETLEIQAADLYENAVVVGQSIPIVLQGGYSCDFSSNPGFTTLHGSLTITDGTVTTENLIIQ